MLIRRIENRETDPSVASSQTPAIWAVLEGRIGDDKQVMALASALGGAIRVVQLRDTIPEVIAGRVLNSLGFHAPWHQHRYCDSAFPDLLIAAGGRSVTLARWVKQASGGRTKTIFLGRPFARLSDFDLVVTTPQYVLPDSPNVQMNLLPLNHVEADQLEQAAMTWAPRFAHLPKPWVGALIGGNSGSFRMTPRCARQLGARLSSIAQATGGSVLLATSARTPAGCGELIGAHLNCPGHVHLWKPGSGENPYLGIIALADQFVVTGESASMIAEAANTGKPVEMFDLHERLRSRLLTTRLPSKELRWLLKHGARNGYWTPPRDLHRLHRVLRRRGYLDAETRTGHRMRPIEWDLARTVARIEQLYAPATTHNVQPAMVSGALANQAI